MAFVNASSVVAAAVCAGCPGGGDWPVGGGCPGGAAAVCAKADEPYTDSAMAAMRADVRAIVDFI
jgi:hypothetical protein